MAPTAFVVTASRGFLTTPASSFSSLPRNAAPLRRSIASRHVRFAMSAEDKPPVTTEASPVDPADPVDPPAFSAPSLDTTVFSDFVESSQEKIAELQENVRNIDTDQLLAQVTDLSKGLVDNLLAGDWLNRGELYGGLQILFVLFILNSPTFLDGLISLITGPLLLAAGGVVSGKAVFDLGSKQLSIWPAPVQDGELKTNGMYEIVRHPIYSGLLLASAGYAVTTHSPARLAITLAMALLLIKKIEVEEDFLMDTYSSYEAYAEDVPYKLFPKVF